MIIYQQLRQSQFSSSKETKIPFAKQNLKCRPPIFHSSELLSCTDIRLPKAPAWFGDADLVFHKLKTSCQSSLVPFSSLMSDSRRNGSLWCHAPKFLPWSGFYQVRTELVKTHSVIVIQHKSWPLSINKGEVLTSIAHCSFQKVLLSRTYISETGKSYKFICTHPMFWWSILWSFDVPWWS